MNSSGKIFERFCNSVSRIRAEVFFAVMASVFGLAAIFITPPLQGPDEDVHFLACHCYSHFTLDIPQSSVEFVQRNSYLPFHTQEKYSSAQWSQEFSCSQESSQPAEKIYHYHFNHANAFAYAIPGVAMLITSAFAENNVILLLAARLACLIFFVAMSFWGIKIIPCAKWVMTMLLLMPSVVFGASVISYDSATLAVAFVVIAIMVRLLERSSHAGLTWRNMRGVFIWAAVLSAMKAPYFLVASPILFWPRRRFDMNVHAVKLSLFVLICTGLGVRIYCQMQYDFFTQRPAMEYHRMAGGFSLDRKTGEDYAKKKLDDLINDPLDFPKCLVRTLTSPKQLMFYAASFIGCLGWLDTLLPPYFLFLYYLCMFGVLCMGRMQRILLKIDRLLFILASCGIALIIFAGFYFINLKSPVIDSIQGRYFIPFAPLILLALQNSLLGRRLKRPDFWPAITGICAVLMIMTVMTVTLLQRYYFYYWWQR